MLSRRPLACRLLFYIMICSSTFALIATALQVYIEYRQDVSLIYSRILQIQDTYLESLASSLWRLNQEQLDLQMQGILKIPDTEYLEIVTEDGTRFSAGEECSRESDHIIHTFPLYYNARIYYKEWNTDRVYLGELRVTATLSGVWKRLRERVLVILGTQAFKTFVVSLFILFVVDRLITRHLMEMADYACYLDLNHLDSPLILNRREKGDGKDELGQVVAAINQMRLKLMADITEQERIKEQLMKAEKLSVLGRLTAAVSHDLRNPLGVIRSSVYILNKMLRGSDPKIDKHLERIDAQIELCDIIVEDLLEYTRGRHSNAVVGDIGPFLEEVLKQMPPSEGIQTVYEADPELPMVSFDREKLRRAIINLLQNAVQSAGERKKEMAEQGKTYQPVIKVSASVTEKGLCLRVEDNGPGMKQETADRAFEPLFTTRARGTGLGLAIVKKIVDEHGGTVSLTSEMHRGTTVSIVLPCTGTESMPSAEQARR